MSDKLILFTCHPEPTAVELGGVLRELELIDTPIEFQGHSHYLAGERFAEWTTFLGCAPNIVTDPEAADSFCHIEIVTSREPAFIGGSEGTPPRCPHCRSKIKTWRKVVEQHLHDPTSTNHCPSCSEPITATEFNWRHYGGFGNLQLIIWGIPPELALPGDLLMAKLQETTGTVWDFLYLSE